MSKTNSYVFKGLHIISWMIFIGLCIETGGLVVNFIFSLFKPEIVPNLYQKLDLTKMYTSNSFLFFSIYGFILLVSFLKAYLFYIVVKLMHKLDLTQPFNNFTANQITQMSYFTLIIGFVSYIAKEFVNNIGKNGAHFGDLNHFWADSQAFIIMGAVIYIIATIFKKGVEIQNENELTV